MNLVAYLDYWSVLQGVAAAGFQWQILVAAIAAGVVFLILGLVCSVLIRRRRARDPKGKVNVRQEDSDRLNTQTERILT